MHFIDLRSDTVTMYTDEMKRAMLNAEVGDDVYEDDPTINRLEALAAEALGKEAALFMPSGTMGNQAAVMTHTRPGDEIIISHHSHIVLHEVGGAARLSGVNFCMIRNENGFVYKEDVLKGIREDDIHCPVTSLVVLDNAIGTGLVVPLDVMKGSYEAAHSHGIPVHLDGARLFNAAAALGCEGKDIAQYADSVMFCLSKGLCAPVGSMLCGTKDFIKKSRRNRKLLGGGMRQAGLLAACGIEALEHMTTRLKEDHDNAKYFANQLKTVGYVDVNPDNVHINMIFFKVTRPNFDHDGFVNMLFDNKIKINPVEEGEYRYVTHKYVSREGIDKVIGLMKKF